MNINAKKSLMFPIRTARKNIRLDKLIFVDPGLTGTGWSYFGKLWTKGKPASSPQDSGVFLPKKSSRWEAKVESVCGYFDGLCSSLQPKLIILEFPQLWASGKSMVATQKGDLFKLTYLIGGLGEVSRRHNVNLPVLVYPLEWKGQLPKDVVIRRIKKRFPHIKPKNHEADAIGMGLAAQGIL